MEFKELIKDIKKIDLDIIDESDVKMFQSEREAVEYYNDAVDSILSGNTDIAAIKLRRVLSLSPDFDEASILLEKVKQYDLARSLGDRVNENIRGTGPAKAKGKRNLPQLLQIDPRVLLKIIIVLVVIAVTAAVCIVLIRLLGNPKESEPKNTEVTYSQQEVNDENAIVSFAILFKRNLNLYFVLSFLPGWTWAFSGKVLNIRSFFRKNKMAETSAVR